MLLVKITQSRYIEGYKINFRFNDGKEKIIDFKNLLWDEVFEPLKDVEKFKNFRLNPFTVEWENGADFAPEYLYHFQESKTGVNQPA